MEAEATAGPVDTRPDAHLLNGPQLAGGGVSQTNVDELMSVSDDVFNAAMKETRAETVTESVHASDDDIDAIMAGGSEPMDAAAIDDMFASAPAATDEDDDLMTGGDEPMDAAAIDDMFASAPAAEPEDDFDSMDPDATLDEAAIERLFDSEVGGGAAEAEADADVEWELTEESAEDSNDPLERLSEAERQALFN
jgi:hypothetical protein